jgi:hypothetical protein
MPMGFCNPPICWRITYNFANANVLTMKRKDVPNWNLGVVSPLGTFPAIEAAFMARLNAGANLSCDNDCICMRLHRRAVTVLLSPMLMGPTPAGGRDLYMQGIQARGIWGICLPKRGGIRIKKGDKWVYPEDLPESDILPRLPSSPSPGGSSHKKKKGKKRRRR